MRQIKLFKHIEAEIRELETEMNDWMKAIQEKGAKIVSVTGNIAPQTLGSQPSGTNRFSPSDLLMIVEYDEA